MKKTDFSDIFNYTTAKYDIGWNECNDIFFDNLLDYKSYNEYDKDDLAGMVYKGEIKDYTVEDVEEANAANEYTTVAAVAIYNYMEDNNINDIFIDSK